MQVKLSISPIRITEILVAIAIFLPANAYAESWKTYYIEPDKWCGKRVYRINLKSIIRTEDEIFANIKSHCMETKIDVPKEAMAFCDIQSVQTYMIDDPPEQRVLIYYRQSNGEWWRTDELERNDRRGESAFAGRFMNDTGWKKRDKRNESLFNVLCE